MGTRVRPLALRGSAGLFAFVFAVPSLALLDLVVGLIPAGSEPGSSHAMGNLAYGVIGAVLVAPAFASQAFREGKAAPLQQLALVALAIGIAAVASGAYEGLAGVAVVLVPLLVVLALRPARKERRDALRPSVSLAVVTLAALPAALAYAWEAAANGREGLPPEDSYAYVPTVWSAIVAAVLATVLVALLAALRRPGWPVPAACVAAAAFLFGVASVVNPDVPASAGRGWGAAVIAWSLVWAALATRAAVTASPCPGGGSGARLRARRPRRRD